MHLVVNIRPLWNEVQLLTVISVPVQKVAGFMIVSKDKLLLHSPIVGFTPSLSKLGECLMNGHDFAFAQLFEIVGKHF